MRKSDNSFAKAILDRVFRLIHNSTQNNLQEHISLRHYTAKVVYLQHSSVYYCRHS